jgi:hypothetical protein
MDNNLDIQYQKIIENNSENFNNLLKQEKDKNAQLSLDLINAKREIIELKQKMNNLTSEFVIINRRPINLPKK